MDLSLCTIPSTEHTTDHAMRKVAIIIPHFQTLELIRLCLRSIRKFTHYPYEVIVVDNHSEDASLTYLQSLKWIRLIARGAETEKSGSVAHRAALDIGMDSTDAPYALSLHSDTIVKHPHWLNALVAWIEKDEKIGAVGTWKLELKTKQALFFQRLTNIKRLWRRWSGQMSEEPPFIRTHCALYRSDLLRKTGLRFLSEDTAGKNVHEGLVQCGYDATFIPITQMMQWVDHLNHTTMLLQKDAAILNWKHHWKHKKNSKLLPSPPGSGHLRRCVT